MYFDSNAVLSVREVEFYKKYDTNHLIEWRDIRHELQGLADRGITLKQAEKQLYVINDKGTLLEGTDALLAVLTALPKLARYGEAMLMPGIKWLVGVYYSIYVKFRS